MAAGNTRHAAAPTPRTATSCTASTSPHTRSVPQVDYIDVPKRTLVSVPGYDQGVVNVLCHGGRLPAATLHPYRDTPVLHLGNTPAAAVACDERGEVVNEAGAPVTVVHQYDRHPELAARLAARWGKEA